MVVLDGKNKRVRVQRIDIAKNLKNISDEKDEDEDLDSNDDSDYEGEVSDESSEGLESDYSDSDSNTKKGRGRKKKSDKPVPPKSNKKSNTKSKKTIKVDDSDNSDSNDDKENDDSDFNLPKKKTSLKKKEKEIKESQEIYEQTLKQANLDQWITKKSSSNTNTSADSNKYFSFSKKSTPVVSTTVAATSSSPSTTTNINAPVRLATIKKPLGSDKNDFFSNFLYKKNTGKSKEDSIKIGDDTTNNEIKDEEKDNEEKETEKQEEEKEKEEDTLFSNGFNSLEMKNVKKTVNKMVKKALSDGEDTEEEGEDAPLVNKKRKSTLSSPVPSKKENIVEVSDNDDATEDEKDKPTKVKSSKESNDNDIVEVEDEDEDEDESDKDEPTIQKLIYACECFSKRMFEILSNSDFEINNTTTNDNNNNNSTSSNQIKNKLIKQPKIINKTMRNYQLIGLNWMALLYKENINGILADEMGLGKTVQTISLLAHIMETYSDCGPHLIIVPATVMSNWGRELETWCPKLKVVRYYGNLKEREELRYDLRRMKPKKDYNIILTTYNLLFSNLDRAFLKKFDYSYLILDEAQNIKNSDSRRYKNIFKIQSKHRLLLTGTPLQNNLFELWSLLNFLMPHIFGSTSKNNNLLNSLLESKDDDSDSSISRMKKILSPFILRRLKSTVSQELKPKREVVERCTMPEFQQKAYDTIIERSKAQWSNRDLIKEKTKEESKKRKKKSNSLLPDPDLIELKIDDADETSNNNDEDLTTKQKEILKQIKNGSQVLNNILMQLRKAANHPLLCKNIFYTENQIDDIVKTLAKKDKEYIEYRNNVPDLKEVFQSYSDYEVFKLICENQLLADKYWIDDNQFYETSAKCLKLKEILSKEIHQNKSKVLIFSQMTKILDILEDVLSIFGESFTRLDGSTPVNERQDIIDHFTNSKDISVFLLSTNAGGLGINLTCANVVIFYDLSFNPQVDRQAEDRAHRLGQEREVVVYKLLTEGTVDINIFNSANQKKILNDTVLEEGSFNEKETKLESKKILKILDSIFTN